jgi:putative transposase
MARLGRYFLPEQPLHVIQRGNNRQAIFFDDDDYVRYRNWLAEAAAEYGCVVHAHALMTKPVHLLATPREAGSLPRVMQSLGRRYVRHVNTLYRRTGTLWEGRYRAAPIDSERYFLTCCRYIELNPVRARMVRHPRGYRWSSYRSHAQGAADALAVGHDLYYDRLGRTRSSGRSAIGLCSATRSMPASSTRCALRRTAAGRSVMRASRARSPMRWADGSRLYPEDGSPSRRRRLSSQVCSNSSDPNFRRLLQGMGPRSRSGGTASVLARGALFALRSGPRPRTSREYLA